MCKMSIKIIMISKMQVRHEKYEYSVWGRKLNNSFGFITWSYFKVTKDVRIRKLKQISVNHLLLFKKCAAKPYSSVVKQNW